jgi:hypothetical protein
LFWAVSESFGNLFGPFCSFRSVSGSYSIFWGPFQVILREFQAIVGLFQAVFLCGHFGCFKAILRLLGRLSGAVFGLFQAIFWLLWAFTDCFERPIWGADLGG